MERLIRTGTVPFRTALEIERSRLGIGFEKLDRAVFDPEKAYDKLGDIGVKYVRIQSGWARTERQKGTYDFAWLDDIVNNLLRRGLIPWLNLVYGNEVHSPYAARYFGNVGCPPIHSVEELQAWCEYVRQTVRHYQGKITCYEIWNEPDYTFSWRHPEQAWVDGKDPGPSAKEYAHFCIETAKTIREADRNAKVIGFALGNPNDHSYVNTALAEGLGDYIDAISLHIYQADDINRPDLFRNMRKLIDRYNPDIRLIQGEAGAQTRSDGAGAMHGFAWTPERQMKYLLRGTIHDLASEVVFTSYFSTMDMIEALHGLNADKASYLDYGYFGVLSADFDENGVATGEYRPKPSYTALRTLAALFPGEVRNAELPVIPTSLPSRRVNGNDCTDGTIQTYGFEKPDGSCALVYWNSVPLLTSTYDGTISFKAYGFDAAQIQLVDLRDGTVYRLPENMTEGHGNGELWLKNLPLTDCPLMLSFDGFAPCRCGDAAC